MLVIDEATVRELVANVMSEADGEVTFYEKLLPEISNQRYYVESKFGDLSEFIDTAEQYAYHGNSAAAIPAGDAAIELIVYRAVYYSIDALNMVITPNGFGVVSNQTIAPASAERTRAFKDMVGFRANRALNKLYYAGISNTEWRTTKLPLFGKTLTGPGMVLGYETRRSDPNSWEVLLPRIYDIENKIIETAVGDVVFDYLIDVKGTGDSDDSRAWSLITLITQTVRGIVVEEKIPANFQSIESRMVDIIRKSDRMSEMWEGSSQEQLWKDNSYKNTMQSGGYWF